MPVPSGVADRLAAEAMIACIDGCDDFGLLPVLCHRPHLYACRRAVLRRADGLMAKRRETDGA